MSSPVPIEERRPLTEAADLMDKHRTLHLGVTKEGSLIGMVSVRDFSGPFPSTNFNDRICLNLLPTTRQQPSPRLPSPRA